MSTPHSAYLLNVARKVAAPYLELRARAVIVAGSVADSAADEWSDIDMILFYDQLPDEPSLDGARETVGGVDRVSLGGAHADSAVLEQYRVQEIACQLVHQTVAAWRAQSSSVLVELDVNSPAQKALSGLHHAVVLHGEELISQLRDEAGYPDALSAAMVSANLSVFPLWRLQGSLARRDADLWQRREIVAGLERILGMLAGVNRTFFSPFQLKHVRALVGSFERAPARLAERIDAAITADTAEAVAALRDLYSETIEIVATMMPEIDLTAARRALGAPLEPWRFP